MYVCIQIYSHNYTQTHIYRQIGVSFFIYIYFFSYISQSFQIYLAICLSEGHKRKAFIGMRNSVSYLQVLHIDL